MTRQDASVGLYTDHDRFMQQHQNQHQNGYESWHEPRQLNGHPPPPPPAPTCHQNHQNQGSGYNRNGYPGRRMLPDENAVKRKPWHSLLTGDR